MLTYLERRQWRHISRCMRFILCMVTDHQIDCPVQPYCRTTLITNINWAILFSPFMSRALHSVKARNIVLTVMGYAILYIVVTASRKVLLFILTKVLWEFYRHRKQIYNILRIRYQSIIKIAHRFIKYKSSYLFT